MKCDLYTVELFCAWNPIDPSQFQRSIIRPAQCPRANVNSAQESRQNCHLPNEANLASSHNFIICTFLSLVKLNIQLQEDVKENITHDLHAVWEVLSVHTFRSMCTEKSPLREHAKAELISLTAFLRLQRPHSHNVKMPVLTRILVNSRLCLKWTQTVEK